MNRVAVYFSSGIGDALLLIPLVKLLKKNNYVVTGIFTSPYPLNQLFEKEELLNEIVILDSFEKKSLYALKNRKKFSKSFLNYFSVSKSNLILAYFTSEKIITNNKKYPFLFSLKINYIPPNPKLHDAIQNMALFDKLDTNLQLSKVDFLLNKTQKLNLNNNVIIIQIRTGNNITTYKNWPLSYWILFLKMLKIRFPNLNFVFVGDESEVVHQNELRKYFNASTFLIGRTSLYELKQVLLNSSCFIGLDGGLMHLAVALDKPTFIIWGGSNNLRYGYEQMLGKTHKDVVHKINCNPCNDWISPNKTKVENPFKCTTIDCLYNLTPDKVMHEFEIFYYNLLNTINA